MYLPNGILFSCEICHGLWETVNFYDTKTSKGLKKKVEKNGLGSFKIHYVFLCIVIKVEIGNEKDVMWSSKMGQMTDVIDFIFALHYQIVCIG